MQGHYSKRLKDVPATVSQPESCIADIYVWCGAKCLQLNTDKTELQWFGSALQLPSQTSTIHVNQCAIKPVTIVRDLGMWFDVELSMRLQVCRRASIICGCAEYVLSVDSSAASSQQGSLLQYCPVASGLL